MRILLSMIYIMLFLKKRNELNRLVKKRIRKKFRKQKHFLKSLMETDVDMKYFFLRVIPRIFIKMKFHLQKIRSNI